VHEFWDQFQPLFAGVQGYRGVIPNVRWTVTAIMDCSEIRIKKSGFQPRPVRLAGLMKEAR
jgi:hypothetical protein